MSYKPSRTIYTENSVWLFDETEMHYVRMPLKEVPLVDGTIPYTNEWEPYEAIIEGDEDITVVRPVPWGSGQLRRTSRILFDSSKVDGQEINNS